MAPPTFIKELDANTLYFLIYNLSASHAVRCDKHKTYVIPSDDALTIIHLLNKEQAMVVIDRRSCLICYLHDSEKIVLAKLRKQINFADKAKEYYEGISSSPSFDFIHVENEEKSDDSVESLLTDSDVN